MHTQTPLWTTHELPKSGPCIPPRCPTLCMSVVPLVLLARFLGTWLALPSVFYWLLWTIRLNYAIQFTQHPPKFRGIHFTSVKAADAHVLHDWRYGVRVLKPLLRCTQESGGLQPILDLRVLNRSLYMLPFKITQKRIFGCIHPRDWFAVITWRTRTFMSRSFCATDHFCGSRLKYEYISTRPCLPVSS